MHHGQGGTLRVDHCAPRRSILCNESLNYPWRLASPKSEMRGNELTEKEASWPIHDHWLFDADEPYVGPDGPD